MARKHRDYIPRSKYHLNGWVNKFLLKIEANKEDLHINEETITKLENLVSEYNSDLSRERELINAKRSQTKKTQKDRKDLENLCRMLAQQIKTNISYTKAVGKDFDIIGAEKQVDAKNGKPVLSAQKVPDGWRFKFGLDDYFNGINVYRKRPSETEFTYLHTKTRSPFVDKLEMENGTEYFAYYIIGDTEVGQESDIVIIEV